MARARESVPAQIAAVLRRGGLNRVGAAGVLGNAYAESSYKPGATGYGGGGLWGFTASPNSLADLQAYAHKRGRSWEDAELQTEFLLEHVPRSLISRLNAAPTPEAAAVLFMTEWERPGIPRQNVRESGARKAFQLPALASGQTPAETHPGLREHGPVPGDGGGGNFGGDLLHIGLVAALVLGGAAMVGLGTVRMFGSAQRRAA